MRDTFSAGHPIINIIFYAGAFVLGMCLVHPAYLLCSVISSLLYYFLLKRRFAKYFLGMFGVFLMISLINPLFNRYGDTVLFTFLGGRPYTKEALFYGMALGAMFVTILTWFATYQEVMTSDKFLYCFGRLAPGVSLIFTMVLRLVPVYRKKTNQIAAARSCVGKSMEQGTAYEMTEHGMLIVSALTSWALEGGVVMADSMKSRGFGCGKRTTFSIYRWGRREWLLLGIMSLLFLGIAGCSFLGGMKVSYVPAMKISGMENRWTLPGLVCYVLFLSIPSVLHIAEEITWHILKSKI